MHPLIHVVIILIMFTFFRKTQYISPSVLNGGRKKINKIAIPEKNKAYFATFDFNVSSKQI